MSILISRTARPELFTNEEKSITEIVNAVESIYAMISEKHDGYNQQELIRACKTNGLGEYEINIGISILFYTKKIISIIE